MLAWARLPHAERDHVPAVAAHRAAGADQRHQSRRRVTELEREHLADNEPIGQRFCAQHLQVGERMQWTAQVRSIRRGILGNLAARARSVLQHRSRLLSECARCC